MKLSKSNDLAENSLRLKSGQYQFNEDQTKVPLSPSDLSYLVEENNLFSVD